MSLDRHQQDWDRLAEVDALWAVLTVPGRKGGRWDVDEFFATGEAEIAHVLSTSPRRSAGRRAASARSTSAAASAGSRARSAPASSTRSASTSPRGWSSRPSA